MNKNVIDVKVINDDENHNDDNSMEVDNPSLSAHNSDPENLSFVLPKSGGTGMSAPTGNFAVPGNLTVPGGNSMPGNLTVPGGNSMPGNLTVPGGNSMPGNLTVPGGNSMPGNLTVPRGNNVQSLNKSSLSVPCPGGLFPLPASQQIVSSGSSTGNPRNKVGLKKGFSLMDWVRLTKSGKDLTGVGGPRVNGKLREITRAELKKHYKKNDCWMGINGAVFNVTPYMEYHPGGWDELVRGAGIDATDLFNEVHRWVNYESLLAACLVGKLVDGTSSKSSLPPPSKNLLPPPTNRLLPPLSSSSNKISTVKGSVSESPSLPPLTNSNSLITVSSSDMNAAAQSSSQTTKPTFDYFQSDTKLTLNIYCKRKGLKKMNFIIDNYLHSLRIICLFPDKTGFIFHQKLNQPIVEQYTMKLSDQGKLELGLVKSSSARWLSLGSSDKGHNWFGNIKDMSVNYRNYKIQIKEEATHDSIYLKLTPLNDSFMSVPPGKHIHIKQNVEGMEITRSYTPVTNFSGSNCNHIELLIKIYTDGAITPLINQLKPGDEIEISDYTGDFEVDKLKEKKMIYLLAAGTGITPMISILPEIPTQTKIKLVNFNKTSQDVIWGKELDNFACHRQDSFQIINIFSEEKSPSSSKFSGRISQQILNKIIDSKAEERLACICGPKGFIDSAQRILKENFDFTTEQIHLFQG